MILIVKREWFQLIAYGDKLEEYREVKPYWEKRLSRRPTSKVVFRLGYNKGAPMVEREIESVRKGFANPLWCTPEWLGKEVFIISLKEGRNVD